LKNLRKKSPPKPKLIVVLGPTASGKSALAVKLAKKFKGEIISADSRQVYKELDIGSGKVTKKEMGGIPHHLLDVASPKRTFTAAQYGRRAEKEIRNILSRGRLPIICGGTGFYIDTLLNDAGLPEVPPNPRLRKRLEKLTADELYRKLITLDSRRARTIDRKNKRRLIRALEIIEATGQAVPAVGGQKGNYDVLKIGIRLPEEELKEKIKKRLKRRLDLGLVAEVKRLRNEGVSDKRLEDLGLEYRYVSRYLRGLISYEEMVSRLEAEIRHYAKRQMTWFKKDKKIKWISDHKKTEAEIFLFIKNEKGGGGPSADQRASP